MKLFLLSVSIIVLLCTACNNETIKNEPKPKAAIIQFENEEDKKLQQTQNMSLYDADVTDKQQTLLLDQTGKFTSGEYKISFSYTQGYDLRLYLENIEGVAYDWTLVDKDGRKIRSGRVSPDDSQLEIIPNAEDAFVLRSGIYSLSMISIDGSNNSYKVSVNSIDCFECGSER
ncbi:hypothetical protein PV403_08505 [Paenibacillus sp. GYB006]|uniref:hypothetical protein n=1 Tax=Paenibacillus sp. GYB006 TaxID=2994394 RepID=UPI002F96E2C8